jgi:hypothetical protein
MRICQIVHYNQPQVSSLVVKRERVSRNFETCFILLYKMKNTVIDCKVSFFWFGRSQVGRPKNEGGKLRAMRHNSGVVHNATLVFTH